MILDRLQNADRYTKLEPKLEKAFHYLNNTNLADLDVGSYDVDEDIVCCIYNKKGKTREEAKLEFHKQHIDIHYVIKGYEWTGWKSRFDCTQMEVSYDYERDMGICADKPKNWMQVFSGNFAIFFPEDSHAPMVSDDYISVAVVKIKV